MHAYGRWELPNFVLLILRTNRVAGFCIMAQLTNTDVLDCAVPVSWGDTTPTLGLVAQHVEGSAAACGGECDATTNGPERRPPHQYDLCVAGMFANEPEQTREKV